MLVSDLLTYWYGVEIPRAPKRLRNLIITVADAFSISLLTKTLFAPWRNDVISTYGLAMPERLRVLGLNLISILVGFVVRLFVLLTALFVIAMLTILGVLGLLIWFIMPALPIILFFVGLIIILR